MPQDKNASRIIIYLCEELGDARLRASQLQGYVKQATDLIEKSPHRDHFFEVAAHLIHGIPQTLFKLGKALDASALAAARLDYEEIKQGLKPEKADELEQVMEDNRLRYLKRRSDEEIMTPKQAARILNLLADKTREAGRVPVTPLLQLIASLEGPTGRVASVTSSLTQRAEDVFRKASEAILTPGEEPSRMALAALMRQVLADTIQPTAQAMQAAIFAQATSRQDVIDGFMSANPGMSDADAEKAADEWEKNKDVVKDKTAVDFKGVAKDLLEKRKGSGQEDLHYRAYLRAVIDGQPAEHLAKKFDGSKQAKQDLIDEAGKAPKTAGAGEEFQKANPAITDEQAKIIDEMHAKHKDNFKAASALDPAAVNAFRDVLLPKSWPGILRAVAGASGEMFDKLGAVKRAVHGGGDPGQLGTALLSFKPERSGSLQFIEDIENVVASWYKTAKNNLAGEFLPRTASDETAEESKESKFEEGKPADPTVNMTNEQKAEWEKQNAEHKDEFKTAADSPQEKRLPSGWVLKWNPKRPDRMDVNDEGDTGWSDEALQQRGGKIVYDSPERIPAVVRGEVEKFFRKVKRMASEDYGYGR